MVSLLVCEPVSSVEQLLSGQPVVRDVTRLPADQVVRHGVPITLKKLMKPSSVSLIIKNGHAAKVARTHTEARVPRTYNFLRCASRSVNVPTSSSSALSVLAGEIPVVRQWLQTQQGDVSVKDYLSFFRPLCQQELFSHALSAAASNTCVFLCDSVSDTDVRSGLAGIMRRL